MKKLFAILLAFVAFNAALSAQSIQGPTGLISTPTADMNPDGTFYAGFHYMDKINFKNLNPVKSYKGWKDDNFQIFFFDITLFKFLEVNFRNNLKPMYSKDSSLTRNVDRNISIKLRLFEERKYLPGIAIGATDFFGNGYEENIYGVLTKHFDLGRERIGVNAGYAYSPVRYPNRGVNGFFAGIQYNPSFYKDLGIMVEYDSKRVNIGANCLLFNHLYLIASLQQCKYLSGGVSYRFNVRGK